MIHQLVYISTLTGPASDREQVLADIADVSERNNPARGITGALFVSDATVVQVLEGPRHNVHSLLKTIIEDSRHENVRIVHEGTCDKAGLQDWAMAVRDVGLAGETAMHLNVMVDAYEKSFKFEVNDFIEVIHTYLGTKLPDVAGE